MVKNNFKHNLLHSFKIWMLGFLWVVTILSMGTPTYYVHAEPSSESMKEKQVTEEETEESSITLEDAFHDLCTGDLLKRLSIRPKKAEILSESDIQVFKTSKKREPIILNISPKDYEALTKIVEAEATNEDLIGKVLIANVVLNRVEHRKFPNTIYAVIHQTINGKVQFSPIKDGRYYSVQVTGETKEAVQRALKGEDYSNGALFFAARCLASDKSMNWFDNHLTKVFQYGIHEFYKY